MTIDELKILNIPSEMFKLFNHSIFPHRGHPTRSMHTPMNIHNMHYLNAFPTSSTFHFNIILNISIISSQWHYQQQQQPHFILTSIHVDMIIISNVISNQYHHKYQLHHVSFKVINSNINNKSHSACTYIFHVWDSYSPGLQETQVK